MALKAIQQQEFQKCFQQWQYHWVKCTAAEVEYFEGDPLSVSCKYTGTMLEIKSFRELHSHTMVPTKLVGSVLGLSKNCSLCCHLYISLEYT
jgi:hypothetical protein